jgi:phosphoribosylglycinamide formyltransferase-1
MKRIAIFASGNGSNAQRLMEHFREHPKARIELVLSNNPAAHVLDRARNMKVPSVVFSRNEFFHSNHVLDILTVQGIDLIVLAGFLWLIPGQLLAAYPGKIINIHPALLPAYGGKGMYGMRVHSAVIASGDRESGISVHFVNEHYDEGKIIFQARCPVYPADTPESLAARIHELEHRHFPEVIGNIISARE